MSMSLTMSMQTTLRQRLDVNFDTILEDPFQGLLYIWEHAPHHVIEIQGEDVEFVLCDMKYLSDFCPGERFGVFAGSMIFVAVQTPERYIPYVVLHEWAEHKLVSTCHIEAFKDEAMEAHARAVWGEIRVAALTLTAAEFDAYITWRVSVERTHYFAYDAEVQDYLSRRRMHTPSYPASKWGKLSLMMASVAKEIGYDTAHELGSSHTDLLLQELQQRADIDLIDVFTIVSSLAFVETDTAVHLPAILVHTVYVLAQEVTRPVLAEIQQEGDSVCVKHINGQTKQTIAALMKRLGCVQSAHFATHGLAYNNGAVPKALEPSTHTRGAMTTADRKKIGQLTAFLLHVLENCTTGAELRTSAEQFSVSSVDDVWMATHGVGVAYHAIDIDILSLATIAQLLHEAHVEIPNGLKGRNFHDPRDQISTMQANRSVFNEIAVRAYRGDTSSLSRGRVDTFLRDHTDIPFDAVPWIFQWLYEEREDSDGEEERILSADGTVNVPLLEEALMVFDIALERYEEEISDDISSEEPADTHDSSVLCVHEAPQGDTNVLTVEYFNKMWVTPTEARLLLVLHERGSSFAPWPTASEFPADARTPLRTCKVVEIRGQARGAKVRLNAQKVRETIFLFRPSHWFRGNPRFQSLTPPETHPNSKWHEDLIAIATMVDASATDTADEDTSVSQVMNDFSGVPHTQTPAPVSDVATPSASSPPQTIGAPDDSSSNALIMDDQTLQRLKDGRARVEAQLQEAQRSVREQETKREKLQAQETLLKSRIVELEAQLQRVAQELTHVHTQMNDLDANIPLGSIEKLEVELEERRRAIDAWEILRKYLSV